MNPSPTLKIVLSFLLLLLSFALFAQSNYDPAHDEEFNIFLLLFATVFVCGLFGAAVVGAVIASLIAFAVFGLIGFGILSTSVAVGLYRKSLTAGFRTFLMIVFGIACGLCGGALAAVAQYHFHLGPSLSFAVLLGFIGGALGGVVLTLISISAVRFMIAKAVAKFKLA